MPGVVNFVAMELKVIAKFRSPFTSKFGIPKQSGLAPELRGKIVFEPQWSSRDALRGLEGFDYIWLIWGFTANRHAAVSPVVRPPVLGGNERVGVFATRSPFRPNPLGLSSVKIERIDLDTSHGPVIHVLGADLMDGTEIYDIKPYVSIYDSHPDVRNGFLRQNPTVLLQVEIPPEIAAQFDPAQVESLRQALSLDPRPHYQCDAARVYGMPFAGRDVKFRVAGDVLTVVGLE